MTTTKSRKATQTKVFEPVAFNRCTCNETGEVFYTVHGDSAWYELRWNNEQNEWQCNCPSAIKARPCKHEIAFSEHQKSRQLVAVQAMAAWMNGLAVAMTRTLVQQFSEEYNRLFKSAQKAEQMDRAAYAAMFNPCGIY